MAERGRRNDEIMRSNDLTLLTQSSEKTRMNTRCFRGEIQHRQLRQDRFDKGRAVDAAGIAVSAMNAHQQL